ncbi:uncharacterized protein [Nicotiana tomentosiformis]|uniref:uncharacterized protein isoform X1 n=1 Tax=Nicotiana tomentosiformis TaxID=4098 RepID=UPI000878F7D6|nr:uncharacterized protein LOC104086468 isoform X1 [Nicotiana tomentosiformis]
MYPITWEVIDQETKHSWSCFLSHLIKDLELGLGDRLTVMSDMQKKGGCVQGIFGQTSKKHGAVKQEEKLSVDVLRSVLSLKKEQEQQSKQHQTVNLLLNNLVQLLK